MRPDIGLLLFDSMALTSKVDILGEKGKRRQERGGEEKKGGAREGSKVDGACSTLYSDS